MSQTIELTKEIHPDSLRGIGLRPSGLQPHQIVVGGVSISAIRAATNGIAYRIGRIDPRNAFTVDVNGCHFLYVRPSYTGYRKLARRRFREIPPIRDVDHVLARTLAVKMNINYVLVALVLRAANRSHGCYEKIGVKNTEVIYLSKVIYADNRIYHKVLSRPPAARQSIAELKAGFDRSMTVKYGLTLKQKGQWNLAFGFDKDAPEEFQQLLQKI